MKKRSSKFHRFFKKRYIDFTYDGELEKSESKDCTSDIRKEARREKKKKRKIHRISSKENYKLSKVICDINLV